MTTNAELIEKLALAARNAFATNHFQLRPRTGSPQIIRIAKPGKRTYCDTDCTEKQCSESHDRRDVIYAIDNGD